MSSNYGQQATYTEPRILSHNEHPLQGRDAAEQDPGPSRVPRSMYPNAAGDASTASHPGDDESRKRQRQDDNKGSHIVSRLKRVHLSNPNQIVEDQTNTMYVVVNRMLKEAHEDMMRRKYDEESHQ